MPNSLQSEPVRGLLDRLFKAAAGDDLRRVRVAMAHPDGFGPTATREQADAYEEIYIPISPEAGRLLYSLIRAARPSTVVEFGTSFAISTIHLAAAVRDNGAVRDPSASRDNSASRDHGVGRVISTELNAAKVARATANIAEAGLADWVTILEGDARQTLATIDTPVEFVLLDGWKNLYLPVLHLLEPRLTPGALVIADDTISLAHEMGNYLGYVRDPANGYLSVLFPDADGLEITCRA
jgi:predicted O-methyltransferase YrrM